MGLPFRILQIVVAFSLFLNSAFAESETLKVGLIIPMTGPGALWGKHIRQGAELAVRSAPRLQLQIEDDHLDAASSVTAYRKLRAEHGICHFVVFGAQSANALIPLSEQDGCLLLAITSDPKPVLGRSHSLRIAIDAPAQAEQIANYLTRKNLKRIAILSTTHDSMLEMANALEEHAAREQMTVVYKADFPKGETDFRTVAVKLQQAKPDAVVNSLLPPSLSNFAKQTRPRMPSALQLGFSQSENLNEIASAEGALDGLIFTRVVLSAKFQEDYLRAFQEAPQSYAGYAFDLLRVLSLVSENGRHAPDAIISEIKRVARFRDGACGELKFETNNSLKTASELCAVRGDEIRCPAQ